MTTTAATTPTMAQITLATTDPAAAMESFNMDPQNLLEDSFLHFLRTSRGSRPLSSTTTAPTGLSPRIYGLSPRLPSALPPSASPRIVEPVTPDRQQTVGVIPFSSTEDTVELPSLDDNELAERKRRILWATLPELRPASNTSVDVVDEAKADAIFDILPCERPAPPPIYMSAPEPRQSKDDKFSAMTLDLPELRPICKPPSQTAPPPWDPVRLGPRASPSPLPSGWEPSPLVPGRSELPSVTDITAPVNLVADRPDSRLTSPMPMPMSFFSDPSPSGSGPTSSVSDASVVTKKRPPRRPHPEMGEDSRSKKPAPLVVNVSQPHTTQHLGVFNDPLRCHRCGQRFARRSNLFKHLRSVHEERRRFPCSMCSLTFKRKDHLIKHIRSVHAKVRNFSCDICGIGFAEKFNRDKHRRSIHETKRAFQCPCGAYFQDRDKMQNCLRCKQGDSVP